MRRTWVRLLAAFVLWAGIFLLCLLPVRGGLTLYFEIPPEAEGYSFRFAPEGIVGVSDSRLNRGIRLLGRRRGGQLLRQRDPHGAQGAPFRDPQRQRHGQLYGLGLPHGLPVSVSADGGLHHPRGRAAREKTPLLFIPCHGRTRPCDLSDAQRHLPPRHGAALPARRERGNSLVAARRRHRFGADLHALDGGGARRLLADPRRQRSGTRAFGPPTCSASPSPC